MFVVAARGLRRASRAPVSRLLSTQPAEVVMKAKLVAALAPTRVDVVDTSGGCGAMYNIEVESAQFKGLSTLKQHKIVYALLHDDIKAMHGLSLKTSASP
ncbi:bola protein [Pelagophyceae sp. CCMP2097]|nr:bola protein [Pelagophyceae sp. CCMP2097]|mmetsp:Transcript_6113/g.19584  ORF Transcript_6113/g.19584 Transcript_6113/m.19584 type:complete len:100 (-) Transcript_6113:150-449(-)|eukprot:CAMPEP_0184125710 /NCGR_PEP_ID=MMETSP0974-20121125/25174_1 /TAXON_ID=483370 /ORGANISM="non described non described, Strain CCMP2097" /LENGTH=99 /DNA_ID=CAMNT_0026429049 /DNA_START=60 /DNA_END=359 /DNA_ORIENTATION=+